MAAPDETGISSERERSGWFTGVAAGLVAAVVSGLVIQFGFDPTILSEGIPSGFGLSGLVAGWVVFLVVGVVQGLVYAAVARSDLIRAYAVVPRTGAYVGVVYGLVLWVLAVVVVPVWVGGGGGEIGSYAVNLRGILSFGLHGLVIGLVYGVSPDTG